MRDGNVLRYFFDYGPTHQDRLIKALRERNISDIDHTNRFLEKVVECRKAWAQREGEQSPDSG